MENSRRLDYRPVSNAALDEFEAFTGRGYATEMADWAITTARRQPGFAEIVAGVDEVNVASVRVLEKLGFERTSSHPGAFGQTWVFRLRPNAPPGSPARSVS
jgi:RimJ/RimL family protein N-acetyltransferase